MDVVFDTETERSELSACMDVQGNGASGKNCSDRDVISYHSH